MDQQPTELAAVGDQAAERLAELTPEQLEVVGELGTALQALALTLDRADSLGLSPADSFRALGIDVPRFAAPMLNQLVRAKT